ncbi:hypothetical protein GQ600_3724 [Phytophthora cactorum]|nr:hypothetical protein GQ600_3724 [Phytophthora cactorum]
MVLAPKFTSKQATAYFFTPYSTSKMSRQASIGVSAPRSGSKTPALATATSSATPARQVEQIIISVLLPKFGITFDGWSFHSEHYVAVFAGFDHDGHAETVMLTVAPLVANEVEDHTAKAHCYAAIVHDPEFETACVSALLGESESLPAGQRRLLQPFESRACGTEATEFVAAMSFAGEP